MKSLKWILKNTWSELYLESAVENENWGGGILSVAKKRASTVAWSRWAVFKRKSWRPGSNSLWRKPAWVLILVETEASLSKSCLCELLKRSLKRFGLKCGMQLPSVKIPPKPSCDTRFVVCFCSAFPVWRSGCELLLPVRCWPGQTKLLLLVWFQPWMKTVMMRKGILGNSWRSTCHVHALENLSERSLLEHFDRTDAA